MCTQDYGHSCAIAQKKIKSWTGFADLSYRKAFACRLTLRTLDLLEIGVLEFHTVIAKETGRLTFLGSSLGVAVQSKTEHHQ